MSVIQEKASMIAGDMQGENFGAATIDPKTILIIISILGDMMSTFKACGKTPAQAQASMANPGLIERISLKNSIRHHAGRLIAIRSPLFFSTLKVGSSVTAPEVEAMMKEVQSTTPAL